MSRILVKNLPQAGVNKKELADYFSEIDMVTDVSLKFNEYGTFRRFAFVGFVSEEAAQKAIERLNNTYFAKSKISIELCKQIKEKKLEPDHYISKINQSHKCLLKENSMKLENGPGVKDVGNQEENKKRPTKIDPFEEVRDDPEFAEFYKLQRNVQENITKRLIWADDVPMEDLANMSDIKNKPDDKKVGSLEPVDDVNEKPKKKRKRAKKKKVDKCKPKEIFEHTIKIKGFPLEAKKKGLKEFLAPLKPISMRLDKRDQVCYASFKTHKEMAIALKKDLQFYNTSRIKVVQCQVMKCKLNKERQREKVKKVEEEFSKYKDSLAETEKVEESGRIFIRNLNYTCTVEDLEKVFSPYGDIVDIHLSIDDFTKLPRGFAFVEFVFPNQAAKAFDELNGTIFQGRNFHLLPAKPKPEPFKNKFRKDSEDGTSSYKTKKSEEQKAAALSDVSNWNMLFLGQNAVADVMSDRQQIDKVTLLTQESKKNPIAVRMALGDTAIVEEIRKFLISQGVELDSFSNAQAPRSKTVIIAKNLPAKTGKRELMEVFSKYGLVSRVILPPNGLTAIIEMQEASEAKSAFRNLAYTKFKTTLFYLEWAPINVFRTKSLDDQEKQELDEMSKLQTGTKIVVKNVPFEATQSELTKIFKTFGELNFVRFVKKPDGQHRGFAFVDFCSIDEALRAFRALCHSTHLYGRKLVLQWAAKQHDLLEITDKNQADVTDFNRNDGATTNEAKPKRIVFGDDSL